VKRSTNRILTTHCGSLIRTREIIEGMKARTINKPYDGERLATDIRNGVAEVVRQQVEIGIDIPNDGEYGRRGFTSYIHERLSGLEPRPPDPEDFQLGPGGERAQFPAFSEQYDKHFRFIWMYPEVSMEEVANAPAIVERFRVTAPIRYRGQAAVQQDIATLKAALQGLDVAEAFITAVTPTSRHSDRDVDKYYPTLQAYLYDLADALHEEYRAIVDAGFVLQCDFAALNPGAIVDRTSAPLEDARKARELAVEVLNHALRDIPEERVRYHHCWGSNNRPHTTDLPLVEILPQMLKIKAQAYGVESANPRHEHEWMVWKDVRLPEGKILIPGLISQSTNVVEHPELVAWRIKNFASAVGKENLMAGVDCGFSQYWDQIRVHPSVQWAKLQSLVEGAALASRELWGKGVEETQPMEVVHGR
jgi:5-methyltetrahydropteroyltriglutamate--homocysteine methyltransferase